jgi:hypothetical protein
MARSAALGAGLLLAATALGGCGGERGAGGVAGAATASERAAQPLGDVSGGSVAQFADCGDWRGGTRAERLATIEVLRDQLTPQRSRSATSPLPDERAYRVFETACAPEYAESLRLYKLYVRVQGFAPLVE